MGVLDRLLEEPWLSIDGISGTSAGAMNAAVLIEGYERDGATGARAALQTFWDAVSRAARFSPLQRSPLDVILGRWTLDSAPLYLAADLMARVFSPYDLNPHDFNPLRQILDSRLDFERIARSRIKLFVTATDVHTGRGRVFRNAEVTADVLLASACLPTLFQAVRIDGASYWDGGYSGNPTITPWSANASRAIRSSCRSIRSSADKRRPRPGRSSTGSTRSPSTRSCSRNCG